jgi:hypothetical protein
LQEILAGVHEVQVQEPADQLDHIALLAAAFALEPVGIGCFNMQAAGLLAVQDAVREVEVAHFLPVSRNAREFLERFHDRVGGLDGRDVEFTH